MPKPGRSSSKIILSATSVSSFRPSIAAVVNRTSSRVRGRRAYWSRNLSERVPNYLASAVPSLAFRKLDHRPGAPWREARRQCRGPSRTWIFQYKIGGKTRRLVLGHVSAIKLVLLLPGTHRELREAGLRGGAPTTLYRRDNSEYPPITVIYIALSTVCWRLPDPSRTAASPVDKSVEKYRRGRDPIRLNWITARFFVLSNHLCPKTGFHPSGQSPRACFSGGSCSKCLVPRFDGAFSSHDFVLSSDTK